MLAIAVQLLGLGRVLPWLRTINYPRAAVAGGRAVKAFQQGGYQGTLTDLERASQLAPDVSVYYTHRYSVQAAFLKNPGRLREGECSLGIGGVTY